METRHRRWAALPEGRATGDRGGDRRRRAEPYAGPRTPGVCPHRITRNTGRAQCARTPDPCNKVVPRRCPLPGAVALDRSAGETVQRWPSSVTTVTDLRL